MDQNKYMYIVTTAIAFNIIGAAGLLCPADPNCVCGRTLALELLCDVNGESVKINVLPNTYIIIECLNAQAIDYNKIPTLNLDKNNSFKSVIFKECPLPSTSFQDILTKLGVPKTMALIYQNSKNLSSNLEKKLFKGLQDLSKLLLSVNGVTPLPDNLFEDVTNLTWLIIRSNGVSLSENLFKPLEKLETLEISHNHMTNISRNLFSHLSFLRKLSLWQTNVTFFSKDLFTGVNVLEELDLSSNELNELPSTIFTPLKQLKKLTLFSNKFCTLPSNLFQNNENLDTILIFNNDVNLKHLPRRLFAGLNELKEVYVQRCGLEVIPTDAFTDSSLIINISLAHNEITVLPESVFNDQINLLDLDLSYNKLTSLPPKIFSSLVKLESLNLGYNSLQEISSFSSLFSLIHFNVEHNEIESVPQGIFNNTRQRMCINMAFNKIKNTNESEDYNNNDVIQHQMKSPFSHLNHLKMLNLSHNEFTFVYEDWCTNGHEVLDISHNNIKHVIGGSADLPFVNEKQSEMLKLMLQEKTTFVRTKQFRVSGNPLQTSCTNCLFFYAIRNRAMNVMVEGDENLECSPFHRVICENFKMDYFNYQISLILIPLFIVITLFLIIITISVAFILNNKKKIVKEKHREYRVVLIVFAESDFQFVHQELIVGMGYNNHLKVSAHPINYLPAQNMNSVDKYTTIVVPVTKHCVKLMENDPHYNLFFTYVLRRFNVIFVLINDSTNDDKIKNFPAKCRTKIQQSLSWNHPKFFLMFADLLTLEYFKDVTVPQLQKKEKQEKKLLIKK